MTVGVPRSTNCANAPNIQLKCGGLSATSISISHIHDLWKGGLHSYRVFGTEGCFEHLSNRGEKQSERTTFSSNKLTGVEKITELPVGFSPFSEAVKKKFKTIGGGGHGGADPYLMLRFAEALINKEKEMPVSLRQGLAMTLPGLYASESVFRNGEKLPIHYPWEKELFQKDIDNLSAPVSGVEK